MAIEAVFFDIDGTLVDSNDLHVLAWERAFRELGHPQGRAALRSQIGKGADTLIPTLMPLADARLRDAIAARHGEIFQTTYLSRVVPFPDATKLIARLHADGKKIVLASSAKRQELDHYTGLLEIKSYLTATTSADDVASSKPAGDIFADALGKVAPLAADQTVAIGDTPYDVLAAGKCGIKTVAVLSGGFSATELTAAGAIAIYLAVEDVLQDIDRSIFSSKTDRTA